jgi:para-nitrobenzyl esterase
MRSILLVATLLFSTLGFAQGGPYSVTETPIGTLVDDPAAAAVLEEHMPGAIPQLSQARDLTLAAVVAIFPGSLSEEQLEEINADLQALPAE